MADTTGTLLILNGDQQVEQLLTLLDGSGNLATQHAIRVNSAPVSTANPLPVAFDNVLLTPTAASAVEVVTGGTAVTAFLASSIMTGAQIINPYGATESLFVDMINVPGTTAPGADGTTVELVPGQSWTAPGPLTTPVKVNAITSAHVFTAYQY
jgi:hypothetical protein